MAHHLHGARSWVQDHGSSLATCTREPFCSGCRADPTNSPSGAGTAPMAQPCNAQALQKAWEEVPMGERGRDFVRHAVQILRGAVTDELLEANAIVLRPGAAWAVGHACLH